MPELAGSSLMICTDCVRQLWKNRAKYRSSLEKDIECSFCQRSIFEVDAFYTRKDVHMCNQCLDLAMRVIEKEEVDRFLQEII
jgi:hypothetical protein